MGVRPVKFIEVGCLIAPLLRVTVFLIVAFESYLISGVCVDRVLPLPCSNELYITLGYAD